MKEEIWKDIPEFGGNYQVSNLGRVRGIDRVDYAGRRYKGKILSQHCVKGYSKVALYYEGCRKMYSVHRLVAVTFIPNPCHYDQINHKDENPLNNKVDNLEWCDYLYNRNYGSRNKKAAITQSSRMKGRCPHPEKKKPVYKLSLSGIILSEYGSVSEAAWQNGLLESKISLVCNGLRKSTGGYKWRFI